MLYTVYYILDIWYIYTIIIILKFNVPDQKPLNPHMYV